MNKKDAIHHVRTLIKSLSDMNNIIILDYENSFIKGTISGFYLAELIDTDALEMLFEETFQAYKSALNNMLGGEKKCV